MATGKIKTLFSDREKTEPLFPRTKTSAISADDGTGLDAILEEVIYSGSGDSTVDSIPINADTLGGMPAENYATQAFVSNKIAEAQLSGGEGQEIDLSGYATKDEMNALSRLVGDSPVSQQISTALDAIDYPVDSVNGKTGAVSLSASDVGAAIGANYLVNGRDLDTVIDSGMYRLDESHPNMPADCFYGQLLVIRGGADTIAQLAFDYTFGKMWVRSAKDIGVSGNGTWSDWNCCYTTGNKPTASDVGALSTSGGKVTGDLTIEKGIPSVALDTTAGSARFYKNANTSADYGTVIEDAREDSKKAIIFLDASRGATDALRLQLSELNATYNVLHTGNKNQITAGDIGAAPAGYGLGVKIPSTITDTEQLDACRTCGFYRYALSGSTTICGIWFKFANLSVYNIYGDECVQELRPLNTNYCLRRYWFDSVWSAWELIGVVKKKLWENANLSNNFNAQTISLDLSGYDGVEIYYYVDSTTNVYRNTGYTAVGANGIMCYTTAEMGYRLHRGFNVTSTGIGFAAATASSSVSVSTLCKPYRIFGIKGVSQ